MPSSRSNTQRRNPLDEVGSLSVLNGGMTRAQFETHGPTCDETNIPVVSTVRPEVVKTGDNLETNDKEMIVAEGTSMTHPPREPSPMGVFLELLKTPAVYRSKGYASHMCSIGADDALKQISLILMDVCNLSKSVQDRYLWNMGVMLLRHGLSSLSEDELSTLAAVASSEDLVLHQLFSLLEKRLS